jgi:ferredoxin-NADP reductase
MPEIIIVNSKQPQKITTVYITPEKMLNQECFIGRDERCCIVLQDSLVSRIHGKISFENGNYYYTDLRSRNGSRLNNELIKTNRKYPLKSSDSLNLGYHLLWLKSVSEIQTATIHRSTPREYMPLATIEPTSINRWMKGELNVRCVQIITETDDVKTFSFVAEPPVLFTYQPGQFVTLNLEVNGKLIKRPYSISSSPSRPHTLDITVKRIPVPADEPDTLSGLLSNWLHDQSEIGSKIKIRSPMGKFTCFANPAPKLLFISAGIGITPMMSMSRWLCDTASEVDIIFFHSVRSPRDLIFRSELELMAARYPNFKLAVTVTGSKTGSSWLGYRGRLNESMLSVIAPDFERRNIYVCGSNSFTTTVKSLLEEVGFPMENYYEESFGVEIKKKSTISVASVSTPAVNDVSPTKSFLAPISIIPTSPKPPTTEIIPFPSRSTSAVVAKPVTSPTIDPSTAIISFSKSSREISCDRNSSILEAAQAQNINLPHGCCMGICGQCKVRKLQGEVIYDDDVDCEEGYVLTCLAKPVGRVKIEA